MTEGDRPEDEIRAVLSRYGGCAFGESFDGEEVVALTKYGEVGFGMNEQGELKLDFGEIGLTVLYNDEGDLQYAEFDVESYLHSVPERDTQKLPDKGVGIMKIMERLKIDDKRLAIVVLPEFNRVEAILYDQEIVAEKVSVTSFENANFKEGFLGKFKLGNLDLGFEVVNMGGDFSFSLGQAVGDRLEMIGVEFSARLDFEGDLFSEDYSRFQRLAQKVLIR